MSTAAADVAVPVAVDEAAVVETLESDELAGTSVVTPGKASVGVLTAQRITLCVGLRQLLLWVSVAQGDCGQRDIVVEKVDGPYHGECSEELV